MSFSKKNIQRVSVILAILLVGAIAVNVKAEKENEKQSEQWLSNTANFIGGQLHSTQSPLKNILTGGEGIETDFTRATEQLGSAFMLSNNLSSNIISPQDEMWAQVGQSLEKATRVVDTAAAEYNSKGKLSDENREKIKKVKILVEEILSGFSGFNSETGRFDEESVKKIKVITAKYNQ